MSPEKAARVILRGVERGRARVLVGWDAYALDAFVRVAGSGLPRHFRTIQQEQRTVAMTARIDLRGSRALVTGATGGLGQAIARRLAKEGAELVLSGRRLDVLEPLAKELGATAITADLEDLADVDRLMEEAGPIDLLVANAALSSSGDLLEYTPEQVARAITVNLHAPIAMARTAALGMVERGKGHIVMIGSVSGKIASTNSSLYNATKFGLRGFALGLPAGPGRPWRRGVDRRAELRAGGRHVRGLEGEASVGRAHGVARGCRGRGRQGDPSRPGRGRRRAGRAARRGRAHGSLPDFDAAVQKVSGGAKVSRTRSPRGNATTADPIRWHDGVMTDHPDLEAAARLTASIVTGVGDEQLDNPTPCTERNVEQLLAHIDGLSQAFAAAAAKDFGPLTDTAPEEPRMHARRRLAHACPGPAGSAGRGVERPVRLGGHDAGRRHRPAR